MGTRKWSELRDPLRADPARAARVDAHRREILAELTLAELRKARALTQVQLAQALDTTQGGVSRIEHQTDIFVSTLRSYIEALGGRLDVIAVFGDDSVRIRSFEALGDEPTKEAPVG